ncbi:lytic transglycosylase domain-containing protein [Rubellimicrobium aerolatum]|uniref:Lytic transglycosylase domain-containing protein n=1 Tax=Rubellimicrobium aerolatum TaxID=490979 RepID=A0ABW0SEG8_9RHOB|nr:lytic transglycosylase domain-containing protein [Rubellimicrobium aerolatum]MBP1806889.1 hypothetical protein [Rubellimicrobium aerolatum]
MGADGSLTSSTDTSFSKHYGKAAQEDTGAVVLFRPEPETAEEVLAAEGTLVGVPAPQSRTPSPEILAHIEATALRYAGHGALRGAGLSPSDWLLLYQANIEIESGYNPRATSPVGAIGLGQLMPGTASILQVDPHDWQQNLDGSARYLLTQIGRFQSAELALAAYNAGPEAVAQYGGIPPYAETQRHVSRVLAVFDRLKEEIGS